MVQARLRAMKSSCAFIEKESNHLTNYFENHWKLREFVITRVPAEGMLLEFGVNRGRSANYISGLLDQLGDNRNYFGFDTFTGLTEDWGGVAPAGTFDRNGIPPELNKRVSLVEGDILETLSPFLEKSSEPIAFVHIDTDTYTPCAHILQKAKKYFANGTIILFDELLGYPNYERHELKALSENLPRESYRFLVFGVASPRANLIKAAIQITDESVL